MKNVLGGELEPCCVDPATGFHRDGYCRSSGEDIGLHIVCAEMTQEFLEYTASRGNDLTTEIRQWGFPGLKPGDRWCLCATRWKEAFDEGCAPPVLLKATHIAVLEHVSMSDLKEKALDLEI